MIIRYALGWAVNNFWAQKIKKINGHMSYRKLNIIFLRHDNLSTDPLWNMILFFVTR